MTDVWRPPADVGADPTVRLYLNYWLRRRPVRAILIRLVLAALMFLLHRGFSMLGVLFLVLTAVSVVGLVVFHQRIGWWRAAAPSLLDGASVTRVRSDVVGRDGRAMLLSVDGGRLYLRVTNTVGGARQYAARQQEVSLVGPNADGVAAVLFDGVPMPLAAKVVPAPTNPRPVPVTDEDLPRGAAKVAVLAAWESVAVVALLGASLVFDLLLFIDGWPAAWLGFAFVLVVGLIAGFFQGGDRHRTVKLLGNGPWQAYPVQLLSWSGDPAVIGQLRMVLTRPDGSQLPVSSRLAPAWLIGNISATGVLWVAGSPRRDRAAVVGLPGSPLVAVVRFRELQAR